MTEPVKKFATITASLLGELVTDFRFWARVPPDVAAILLLPEVPPSPIHPVAARPPFPPGVCTGCGCTEDDPCLDLIGTAAFCHWIDAARSRCSACGPVKQERRRT